MPHFIHTADLHLGRAFKSIGGKTAAELEAARYYVTESLQRLVQHSGAQFILIAGDLFDSPRPTGEVLAKALQALGKISVPIYCIPGNHDPGGPLGPYETETFVDYHQRYAQNLHVLDKPTPLILEEHRCIILPCPVVGRPTQDPTHWLRSEQVYADLPDDFTRIVLAHGSTIDFQADNSLQSTINIQRLPTQQLDYIALGDWHGSMSIFGNNCYYAGTPEADKFPLTAAYKNGVALSVTVSRGQPPEVEQHITGRFDWAVERRTIRDAAGVQRLDDELLAATSQSGRLLRLVLDGSLNVADAAALKVTVRRLRDVYAHAEIDQQNLLVAPGPEELHALTQDPRNPSVGNVAAQLAALLDDPEQGPAARLALVKLYEAVNTNA